MSLLHPISVIPPEDARDSALKMLDAVPDSKLVEWSLKLFGLMNLAWDYIDTICDLCIQMRLADTKPLVRTVRHLKREYDIFRQKTYDRRMEDFETDHGLRIEEYLADDLRKLANGLDMEARRIGLKESHRDLLVAVYQALTLMDAVKGYARLCDRRIAGYGVWTCDCCMVFSEFLRLYPLIPQFGGDCLRNNLDVRVTSARIIVNRLDALDTGSLLCDEERRIYIMPEEWARS